MCWDVHTSSSQYNSVLNDNVKMQCVDSVKVIAQTVNTENSAELHKDFQLIV